MGRKAEDLTGQKFNEWEALEYLGNKIWKCRCSCGEIRNVSSGKLKGGYSKSCGHDKGHRQNLTNMVFGELKALEYIGDRKWRCECSCGNIVDVHTYALTSGHTKSCGHSTGKLKDMKGQIVNGIEFLEYTGDSMWRCRCHCGTEFIASGRDIRYGNTKSCGCLKGAKPTNLLNKHFGEWEVLEYIGDSMWRCKCSCGEISDVSTFTLTHGTSTKCNSPLHRLKDLKGEPFGELTVLEYIGNGVYKCRCSCGNYKNILAANLKNGSTRSCGCKWNGVSQYETDIITWLKEITSCKIVTSDRTILNGRELDIYIPEKKIAIEFNGVFWHSEQHKDKNYHQQKTLACAEQGIHLIHIFEHEWADKDKQPKIKNYLYSSISDTKTKIGARNTIIKEISTYESEQFITKYHLQGNAQSSIKLGCISKETGEILGVMTLGTPRFNNGYEYEIIRVCWNDEVHVIGGIEKLFSYFVSKYEPTSVITYCDISKFTGNSYLKIGFKPIQPNPITTPNYVWVKTSTFETLSRYQTQKHKLVALGLGTEEQTEDEIMHELGYLKVYDSGNLRLEWKHK